MTARRTWVNKQGTWRLIRDGNSSVLQRWDPDTEQWRHVRRFYTVDEAVAYSYDPVTP